MDLLGDLLFGISQSREKAQGLAISIAADVRSIEDATNTAIELINRFLVVKREPVDSRGKTINDFLADVRQAFEDLENNAEEQYTQLSTTIDTTAIDDLRNKMLGFDLGNMAKWMGRFEAIPPKVACSLAVIAFGAIVKGLTRSLKATPLKSLCIPGSIICGGLGGLLVFSTVEAVSCAIERKMLNKYIGELTQAEQTMREIRKAFVNVADRLKLELMLIQLKSGNVGDGRRFYFGCVSPLLLCITSSNSIKSIPSPPCKSIEHTVHSPTSVLVALNRPVPCATLD